MFSFSFKGQRAAVKTFDLNRARSRNINSLMLVQSFLKEIKMAYMMRQETRHVVTIFGFDFSRSTGLALMAMELGGDSLAIRIEKLHKLKNMTSAYHLH